MNPKIIIELNKVNVLINFTQDLIFHQLTSKTQRKTPRFEQPINLEEIETLFWGDQLLVEG